MGDEAFYGLAGEVVAAVEDETEADREPILVQFLAAFGNIVGFGSYYEVENDRHFPRLFALVVGDSSSGSKGISWKRVEAFLNVMDAKWCNSRVFTGLSTGPGLAAAAERVKGEKQSLLAVISKLVNEDDNKELSEEDLLGLFGQVRAQSQDESLQGRIFIRQGEFGSVLRVMQRTGETLSHVLRDAWDGNKLSVLTKSDPINVSGVHISLASHITEEELLRELNSVDMANGFGNRFLYVSAFRRQVVPSGRSVPSEVLRDIGLKLEEAKKHGQQELKYSLSDSAERLWESKFEHLTRVRKGLTGKLLSRHKAQVIRLSLIYAILDKSPGVIELPHLEAAFAVWDYCEASVEWIFRHDQRTGNPIADKILSALRETDQETDPDAERGEDGDGGLTKTEISVDVLHQKYKASLVDEALYDLERAGLVRKSKYKKKGAGRPKTKYYITESEK